VVAYQAGTFPNHARTKALAKPAGAFCFGARKKKFSRRGAEFFLISSTGAICVLAALCAAKNVFDRNPLFDDENELRVSVALRESFLKGPPMPNRH
jgi:hypothetical protein